MINNPALCAIFIAFSMYTVIPVPALDWTERNLRYALLAFPLVGIVIGIAEALWSALCAALGFPPLLTGAGRCLLPLLITGGIHMDGFVDTCDALGSHASYEKKHEILKDPHIGAFGSIRLGMYLVAALAVWTSLPGIGAIPATAFFVLSRALSGFSLMSFPLYDKTGLAGTFAEAADKPRVRQGLLIICCFSTAVLIANGFPGLFAAASAWLTFAVYYRMAKREFGGTGGDLAGWFLQTTELCMPAAYCFITYLEAAL